MRFVVYVTIADSTGTVVEELNVPVESEPKDVCRIARERAMKHWREYHGKEPCTIDTPVIGITRKRSRKGNI